MAILKGIVCEEKNGEEEITQLRSFPIRETRRRVFTAYPRFNQAAAFRFDAHTVFLLCLFCKINHRISKIGTIESRLREANRFRLKDGRLTCNED